MFQLIIILAVGIGVAAAVAGVMLMLRPADDGLEDRLSSLTDLKSSDRKLREQEKSLMSGIDDVPGMVEQYLLRFFNVRLMIEQADVAITLPKFFSIVGGLAAAGAIVPLIMRAPLFVIPFAAAGMALLPFVWLKFAKRKRLKAFGAQLPEALELMARGLRAGHSLQAGFQLVGEEITDPLGSEFLRVFEEQNLGISLDEALGSLTDRVPNLDLQFFATAVVLQRQTGGDLAEILDKIGTLIRARFKIFGQIQALTGEGRLSGIVLLAMPPTLFVVMLFLNYDYTMQLFEDPMGKQMLAGAVFLQIIGAIVIQKIVNIKV